MPPLPDDPHAAARSTARRSGRGLDWLNFFTANLQTAFGPFISVYLTTEHWTQAQIGFVLGAGYIASMASQVPAGALVDAIPAKRAAAAAAIVAIIAGALMLAAFPALLPVTLAEVLHGFASCMLSPAIAAIALGIAGRAVGERLGRNARFASIGNALAAGLMGGVGTTIGPRAVFLLGAILAVPGLLSLRMISEKPADGARAPGQQRERIGRLLRDRRLLIFLVCCAGFHLANAAMLPLAAAAATARIGNAAELVIAACIVVPQAVVALLSPAVGRSAERWGRRPVMALGFAALPARGLLLALHPDPAALIAVQALDGISGAAFGVLLPLVASDLTRGSGRFNLAMGVLGLGIGAAAAASTWGAGRIADHSLTLAFLALAAAGAVTTALAAFVMPETRVATPQA